MVFAVPVFAFVLVVARRIKNRIMLALVKSGGVAVCFMPIASSEGHGGLHFGLASLALFSFSQSEKLVAVSCMLFCMAVCFPIFYRRAKTT